MSDALERLRAEADCRDLVVAAAAAVDASDPAAFAALFAPDGVLERPDGSRLEGREAIRAVYAARGSERLTRHLITNHVVRLGVPGTATSHCSVLLWSGRRSDPATPQGRPADARQQVGEFDDVLVRLDEGWRIARRSARFVLCRDVAG